MILITLMLALVAGLSNHGCMTMGEEPDYLAIHEAFAATEYGQVLAANIRYKVYKPEIVSNQHWIELLGPDVDNLAHLASTYHLTDEFIDSTESLQPEELSPRDKAVLRIAAITHDEAESILEDVNYSDKTAEHETAEQAAFKKYLPSFHPEASPETTKLIKTAVDEVIFNRESRLGRMFNAVERISYLRTAMRAGQHLYEGTAPECAEGLGWLVADTLSNHQATHVIAAGRRFPAAHRFLELHQADLDMTFQVGMVAGLLSFAKFDPTRAAAKEANLESAIDIWDSWCGEFDESHLED